MFITINELKKQLQKWPEVKMGDSKAVNEPSDFLELCLVNSNSLDDLKMFGGPSEIDPSLKKLPRYLTDRWRRIVDQWIYKPRDEAHPPYPPFAHFVQFVSREARNASAPVLVRGIEEERKAQPKPRNARVLLTSAPNDKQKPQDSSRWMQQHHCVVCKQDHPVDSCLAFTRMPLKDRQELVRQRGLCGGCLRRGHRWREYRN